MAIYLPLRFLQEKISELQTALFFPISESVLKMPVAVIETLAVDEIGQIWFVVPRPVQYIHEFNKEFPAKLDFFKKQKQFYVKILGKAFIITDPEEINNVISVSAEIMQKVRNSDVVLIKVKIQNADYSGNIPKTSQNWLKNAGTQLYNLLFNRQNRDAASLPSSMRLDDGINVLNAFSN